MAATAASWELTSWTTNMKQTEWTGNGMCLSTLKVTYFFLLNFHKQCYQLKTWCSNTWAYGGGGILIQTATLIMRNFDYWADTQHSLCGLIYSLIRTARMAPITTFLTEVFMRLVRAFLALWSSGKFPLRSLCLPRENPPFHSSRYPMLALLLSISIQLLFVCTPFYSGYLQILGKGGL